jgi:hypothetical protein
VCPCAPSRPSAPQDILPLYFKHDNLRSFIRQLNIYGFQRVPNAPGRDRTMEFQHSQFTRNGMRNLREIKRGNQPKKHEHDDGLDAFDGNEASSAISPANNPAKRPRHDYTVFKADVARLQQNLDEFEQNLKEHSMQVQMKLSYILHALDEVVTQPTSQSTTQAQMQQPAAEMQLRQQQQQQQQQHLVLGR